MKILPMKLSIEIMDRTEGYYKEYDQIHKVYLAEIIMDYQVSRAEVFTSYWDLKTYEKQWKEALERLKTHEKSCFVEGIMQRDNKIVKIDVRFLYKTDLYIECIHMHHWGEENVKLFVKNNQCTLDNCYDLIPERQHFEYQSSTTYYVRRFPTYYV